MIIARTRLIQLCWAGIVLLFCIYVIQLSRRRDTSDFNVYYQASQRLNHEEFNQVYDWQKDGSTPYRYIPLTLPFLKPLALLSYLPAKIVWFILQFGCFLGGMIILFRSLNLLHARALEITMLSALFAIRYWIDSFTSGQVTPLMFLATAAAIRCWQNERSLKAGAYLALPAMLKVGPLLFYLPFCCSRPKFGLKIIGGALFALGVYVAVFCVQRPLLLHSRELFSDWWGVVQADAHYVDAANAGNQSLKGLLLRLSANQWLSAEWASKIWKVGSLGLISALIFGCVARKTTTALGKLLWINVAILVFLIVMPQTFKYSLPFLTFPMAGLLASIPQDRAIHQRSHRIYLGILVPLFVVHTLCGKDVVGDFLSLGLQHLSIPFFGILVITAWSARASWTHSKWRY